MRLRGESPEGRAHADVVTNGQIGKRRGDLMRVADAKFDQSVLAVTVDAVAVEEHRATVRAQGADNAPEQRGLPGAVGSDQTDDLAWEDVERYLADRGQARQTVG